MKILSFDTSTPMASIALEVDGQLFTRNIQGSKEHAKIILPTIEALLSEAKIKIADLDRIVFGRGPGSFTGLRIACSVAKGLAFAHEIELVPVSTLAAIAHQAFIDVEDDHLVLAVIDARMKEWYWASFAKSGALTEEQVSLPAKIHIDSERPILLAGVGFEEGLAQLDAILSKQIVRKSVIYPEASVMIQLSRTPGFPPVRIEEASPVYIRNDVVQGGKRG